MARHPLTRIAGHRRRLSFFRQLRALVRSGMGLPTAFAELARYEPERRRRSIAALKSALERGDGLAPALAAALPEIGGDTVALVAAAEKSGRLDAMLGRIVAQMEE